MSKPVTFEDGRLPTRVVKPLRTTILPAGACVLALGWLTVLGLAETFLVSQLLAEGADAAAWARFILPNLALPSLLRWGGQCVARWSYRVSIENDFLDVRLPGNILLRTPYSEIAEISVEDGAPLWISLKTIHGDTVKIPNDGLILPFKSTHEVVRVVGKRLEPNAVFRRGDRPPEDKKIARLFWDDRYDPPAITMRPGVRYRAIDPNQTQIFSVPLILAGIMMFQILSAAVEAGSLRDTLGWLAVLAVALVGSGRVYQRLFIEFFSAKDRYEIADDGMWIVRGTRRWKVSHPTLVSPGLNIRSYSRRPILKYGRGWNAYYFDPRLIEEDI